MYILKIKKFNYKKKAEGYQQSINEDVFLKITLPQRGIEKVCLLVIKPDTQKQAYNQL